MKITKSNNEAIYLSNETHQSLDWKESILFITFFGISILSLVIGFCKIVCWSYAKVCSVF